MKAWVRFLMAALLACVTVAGGTAASLAQENVESLPEEQAETFTQVPLTSDLVVRFLDSWRDISSVFTELDDAYEPGDVDVLADELTYLAASQQAVAALEPRIRDAGFESFEQWNNIAQSVLLARIWLIDPPDTEAMDAAEAEIREMEDVSDEDRAQLLENLAEARHQVEEMRPSDENLAAVEPHLDYMEGILGGSN